MLDQCGGQCNMPKVPAGNRCLDDNLDACAKVFQSLAQLSAPVFELEIHCEKGDKR